METLKSTLKFWQEIIFVAPIGIFLTGMLIDVFKGQPSMFDDALGIATFCFLLILFICLIGQFFWKNTVLSFILTPILVLYSLFWVFVSIAMPRDNPYNNLRIVVLISALFFIFAAITMPIKYSRDRAF